MRADGCGYEIPVRIVGTQDRLRESKGTCGLQTCSPGDRSSHGGTDAAHCPGLQTHVSDTYNSGLLLYPFPHSNTQI